MSIATSLAQGAMLHLPARVRHTRMGGLRHAFSYGVDYILFAPELVTRGQGMLARNGRGLLALNDGDHGGCDGGGAAWVWAELARRGIARRPDMVLGLMTQPRIFGFGFNPVSFWLLWQGDDLIATLAEVNNTWHQRHSYLCHLDGAPITSQTRIAMDKVFHVSPFQDVGGSYAFRFAVDEAGVDILITHQGPKAGLVARMRGQLRPLRQRTLAASLVIRPGGALRVVALIYFHALRLKLQGAGWRPLPAPPTKELTE